MKLLIGSQIVLLVVAGAAVGAFGVLTHVRVNDALAASSRCVSDQANLTKELNEKIFPQVQKEITDLKASVATRVAKK